MPAAAMQAELEALTRRWTSRQRPVAAIVGGAKISTKLDLLGNLLAKVDALIIGGAMANTFLLAQGKASASRSPNAISSTPRATISPRPRPQAARSCCRSMSWWRRIQGIAPSRVVDVDASAPADMILDIGPRSVEHVVSVLARAKTLVWNGPFGAFELEPFDNGTIEVAEAAAELTEAGKLVSVAGGGDTVAALNAAGAADRSPMSRPPVARFSNGWKARPCRGSRR